MPRSFSLNLFLTSLPVFDQVALNFGQSAAGFYSFDVIADDEMLFRISISIAHLVKILCF
jgi:hypothetical protein